jgi:cathepsin A (carboxypeptidase C)
MLKIMIQVDRVIQIKEMSKIYHTLILSLLFIITLQASKKPSPVIIDAVQKVYNQTWYSGYLDIKDTKLQNVTHHMHYFFFPSQENVSSDPLLFWFNGGPGCSSLLGALYEHGPFLVHDAFGMLMYNKYSWNRKASVVYIESPSEVGFSYMDNKPKNYTWTDDAVAVLNRDAVLEFFSVFTEFKNRKTYIAGESYGGIYVPTLFEK